jgi:predicted short-subunit dehydrogenase-like oxidoreductase (DUF2520 family)
MEFGLFAGGAIAKSFIARIPHLSTRLGPVACTSFRVASRIVNSLHAGYPVRDVAILCECDVVLIGVPDSTVPEATYQLAAADSDWSGRIILLCSTTVDSRALLPLRERGALVASLHSMEGVPARFAVEGDRSAVIRAKRLARELRARPVEFQTSHMDLYAAGKTFATSIFLPLIAAAADCFSKSGAGTRNGIRISEALFHSSLRAFLKAGKRAWNGSTALGDPVAVQREIQALCHSNPLLARYYRQGAQFALEFFSQRPGAVPALDEDCRLGSSGPGVNQPTAWSPQALSHRPDRAR